jgi:serine phosphatase RsbU (regulator of sigma subunit)
LGILRNSEYCNYVEVNEFQYSSGDIMLLYTDGIVEAQNKEKEDFGYDRLKDLLHTHHDLDLHELRERIIDELYDFCGSNTLDDDYTIVLVRFK